MRTRRDITNSASIVSSPRRSSRACGAAWTLRCPGRAACASRPAILPASRAASRSTSSDGGPQPGKILLRRAPSRRLYGRGPRAVCRGGRGGPHALEHVDGADIRRLGAGGIRACPGIRGGVGAGRGTDVHAPEGEGAPVRNVPASRATRSLASQGILDNTTEAPVVRCAIASEVFSAATASEMARAAPQIFGGHGLSVASIRPRRCGETCEHRCSRTGAKRC